MIIEIALLGLGLILLVAGANWLVNGASSLATRLGVSALTVGLTIVAFGTSMPELVVNIVASINGTSGIAIGNVLGSNTMNILLIIGISAIITPVNVQSKTVRVEIPFTLLAAIVLLVLGSDKIIDGTTESLLSRIDGIILMIFLMIFIYYSFLTSKINHLPPASEVKPRKIYISILLIIVGIAGLYAGGKLVVDSATTIALSLGVSHSLIGLTVVAIGTSLPELITSAVAAYRGNSDIAIGNVVGSNIFNIFMVLGISSFIRPLPFYPGSTFDILVTCVASIMLFVFVLVGPDQKIDRREGALFVTLYLAYLIYLIIST
jgi:cation:H+ antiporter